MHLHLHIVLRNQRASHDITTVILFTYFCRSGCLMHLDYCKARRVAVCIRRTVTCEDSCDDIY